MISQIDARIVDWTVPMIGNRKCLPYGTIRVTAKVNGQMTHVDIKMKGGTPEEPTQYIVLGGVRYKAHNIGSLYEPKLIFTKWEKTLVDGRLRYVDEPL